MSQITKLYCAFAFNLRLSLQSRFSESKRSMKRCRIEFVWNLIVQWRFFSLRDKISAPSMVRYVDKKLGDLSHSSLIWSTGMEKIWWMFMGLCTKSIDYFCSTTTLTATYIFYLVPLCFVEYLIWIWERRWCEERAEVGHVSFDAN